MLRQMLFEKLTKNSDYIKLWRHDTSGYAMITDHHDHSAPIMQWLSLNEWIMLIEAGIKAQGELKKTFPIKCNKLENVLRTRCVDACGAVGLGHQW